MNGFVLPAALDEGLPHPMGASLYADGDGQHGVNVAVFSGHATAVELCVFDAAGAREMRRYALRGPVDGLWCGRLRGAGPGLVYGLRAHGPWAPEAGHRFNPHKLALDPLARELVGLPRGARPEHHAYALGHPDGTRAFDAQDNAALAVKARVAAPAAPPPPCRQRHRPQDRVLYELHAKGFSMLHPGIAPTLRGSYAALAHPAAIAHYKALGVTTLSLLPVQQHLDEPFLAERGLSNYWGYNTLAFCCPDVRMAQRSDDPAAPAREFRAMVAALHEAGLEVVLDIVFNHTAEGSEAGPSLSWRGLDQASWYRLREDDPGRCENWSHCGNTLNAAHPRVMQWVLDVLRFWVGEMGVDGFRFDLAPVLGRDRSGAFRPDGAFFAALQQDPLLQGAQLIAEAWDGGPDGYQVGRFPGRWMEWNDRFRDAARLYWLPREPGHGARVGRGELARRLAASSDLFQHGGRSPLASVNFITAHDGFTLADCSAYSTKHNQANAEDNRDGRDGEAAANAGVEGPCAEPAILDTRRRVRRALLATLALASGTPMLLAGDEFGNSQGGNNNAWCQDNPIGWLDWPAADQDLCRYVGTLFALRRELALLRPAAWPGDAGHHGDAAAPQREWLHPAGHAMRLEDWHDAGQSALACLLRPGDSPAQAHATVLLALNPEPAPQRFVLPPGAWALRLDSSGELPAPAPLHGEAMAPARSLVVLQRI